MIFFGFFPSAAPKEVTTGTSPNLRDDTERSPNSLQSSPILRRDAKRAMCKARFRSARRPEPASGGAILSVALTDFSFVNPQEHALETVAAKIGSTDPLAMRAVAGKLADAESIVALKDLFNRAGAGDTVAEGVEGSSRWHDR